MYKHVRSWRQSSGRMVRFSFKYFNYLSLPDESLAGIIKVRLWKGEKKKVSYGHVMALPELRMNMDPLKIYEFNARMWIDKDFRQQFSANSSDVLEEFGFRSPVPVDLAPLVQGLSDDELAAVNRIANLVSQRGMFAQHDVEYALAQEGYLQPAIAILILIVAVAVAVALWVAVFNR